MTRYILTGSIDGKPALFLTTAHSADGAADVVITHEGGKVVIRKVEKA